MSDKGADESREKKLLTTAERRSPTTAERRSLTTAERRSPCERDTCSALRYDFADTTRSYKTSTPTQLENVEGSRHAKASILPRPHPILSQTHHERTALKKAIPPSHKQLFGCPAHRIAVCMTRDERKFVTACANTYVYKCARRRV